MSPNPAHPQDAPVRALFDALCEFDTEPLLSLVRPGRLGEWKQRLYELRQAIAQSEGLPPAPAPPEENTR